MLFDWFTVGAQIVNFLILLWALKRLLYKPILTMMDEREKGIAANIAAAAAAKAEADNEKLLLQKKHQEFEHQRQDLLTQAERQAAQAYELRLEAAKKELEAMRTEWMLALEAEKDEFLDALSRKIQKEIFAIAEQVLSDLADTELEQRMAMTFARDIGKLFDDPDSDWEEVLQTARHPVRIRSAFPLSAASRLSIQAVLQKQAATIIVEFESDPELIGGIELWLEGKRVSWTMAQYLASLQKTLEDMLERKINRHAARTETHSRAG